MVAWRRYITLPERVTACEHATHRRCKPQLLACMQVLDASTHGRNPNALCAECLLFLMLANMHRTYFTMRTVWSAL